MRKFVLGVISLVTVFSLVGCAEKEAEKSEENTNEAEQEEVISNIASVEFDSLGNPFVKLSDSYYLDDSQFSEVNKKEILPSKIYLMDDNKEVHISVYNEDITIDIPIEKCETLEEERIVYSDYGIEKMLNSGKVRIGGIEVETLHLDSTEKAESYRDYALYYTYFDEQKIYEVDLDGETDSKEILVYARYNYPWDSYEYPSLIKYTNGVAEDIGVLETESLIQIDGYKNVMMDGWNSDVEGYFSNLLMGYYVYDKDLGLVHIEKMANGDNINDIDISKLDNCILARDVSFSIVPEDSLYSGKATYSTWTYGEDSEIVTLPAGTLIKVIEIIDDYVNFIGETADGTRYGFFQFASRT